MSAFPSSNPGASPERSSRLSDRQRVCLSLAGEGLTSTGIGERLGLSARTVDEHLMLACRALGVRTRVQAVVRLAAEARCDREPRTFPP